MKKKIVDCEICTDKGFELANLIEHYQRRHGVNQSNPLLLNYLTSLLNANQSKVERCVVCETVTSSLRAKAQHMLQLHSSLYTEEIDSIPIKVEVGVVPDIDKIVYTLSIFRSGNFYDYEWGNTGVVDAFLKSGKIIVDSLRIKEVNPSKKINVSVSYSIINKDTRSTITRYLPVRGWSTSVIKTISLNETVMESLKSQIKSKIIQNGESGSHITFSHFKSFKLLVTSVNDGDVTSIFGGDADKLEVKDFKFKCLLSAFVFSVTLISISFVLGYW